MPLYYAFNLYIRSEIPLPELMPADEEHSEDVQIRLSSIEFPELVDTQIHRRGVMAQSASDADGSIYMYWEGVAGYKAVNGQTLFVRQFTDDPNVLSLFTVSEALGCILLQRGLFLLHASSVQVGTEAFCFMGVPGAGKSTTASAFVKQGALLLSDDLTAVAFDEMNVPYVLPAYPQLKIWEKTVEGLAFDKTTLQPVSEGINKYSLQPKVGFPQRPVRLTQVYFFHKEANGPALEKVKHTDVPIELIRHFPLASHLLEGEVVRRHFTQSLWCATSADVWMKRRPNDFLDLEHWVASQLVEAK